MRAAAMGLAAVLAGPALAQTDEAVDMRPLSAIDWLSESVRTPTPAPEFPPMPGRGPGPHPPEDPVAESATTPDISVRPLDAPSPERVGLMSPATTGLPQTLWAGSEAETLVALMRAEKVETLVSLRDLLVRMILTEADPPADAGSDAALFLARVDTLLDIGALEPAQAMLEAATPDTSALFRRWFDVSLLTGTERRACEVMQDRPGIAPSPAARIFCLARAGDWSAAALTLNTAEALGDMDTETADLMAWFLDPELFEGETPPRPDQVTPLIFRIREAVGERLGTTGLPRAFAHSDLRDTVGWKSQIEAGERLLRTGAIPPTVLLDLYTERVPSASGGVWERARAVQQLETALDAGDGERASDALEAAWDRLTAAGTEAVLVGGFADRLSQARLTPRAEGLRYRLLMLTADYETHALDLEAPEGAALLRAVARGQVTPETPAARDAAPVRSAFAALRADERLVEMAGQDRLGEAILRTIATVQQGLEGDPAALAEGLSTLRALGLEDIARRTALHHLVLSAT
ncbi:MAG: hypothetical protein RI538_01740 [Salibaculum sp.]|uniref:hypothetical protein n=1 Tax=Salibaculum sp. TaxID=2855480 RepID=UPI00286FE458|nr:hypothetical protein [Salibaculum sp.]MDR9427195.1 hypothetical protein [Salibaculum sp.]MDR9481489.1 hypothetical protein [Salibaculum sp.]